MSEPSPPEDASPEPPDAGDETPLPRIRPSSGTNPTANRTPSSRLDPSLDPGPPPEPVDDAGRVERIRRWVRRLSRPRKALLGAALLVAFGGFLLAALLVDLVFLYPGFDRAARPVGAGAAAADWRVLDVDGIPVLESHGLAYPTDLDEVDHPRQLLSGTWRVRIDPDDVGEALAWFRWDLDDGDWETITVPSTIDAVDGPHPDYDGVAWFRRRFAVEHPPAPGETARLTLRAVLLRSTIWLNGKLLGHHEGGYTPIHLDATDALRIDGENLLVVRADDGLTEKSLPPSGSAGHRPGWAAYLGVYRDVWLETLPAARIVKAAATPAITDDGHGRITLELVARLPVAPGEPPTTADLAVVVTDPDAAVVARATTPIEPDPAKPLRGTFVDLDVAAPRLWSPDDPAALYRVEVTLTVAGEARHRVAFLTGIRTFAVDGTQLLLNGEPIRLRGIAKHEDHPLWGATQPPSLRDGDLQLVGAMNANFVRLSHYPHAADALAAARDRGLLVAAEIPLYQVGMGWLKWLAWERSPLAFPRDRFGLRHLHDPTLLQNAQRQLIEMVERDRNNPAVVLWGIGNESYSLGRGTVPVYRWLGDVVRELDPSRPLIYSELTYGIDTLDARRSAGHAVDVVGINMYWGWYFGEASDAAAYLDAVHAAFPEKPIIVTECGAGAALGRTDADGVLDTGGVPGGRTYSESHQAAVLETLFEICEERPWVAGFCPWVLTDFRCPWFPRNPVPGYNGKGVLTREREAKEGYRTLQRLYGR